MMIISKFMRASFKNLQSLALLLWLALGSAVTAWAQAGPYENTTAAALNESVANCGGTHLTRDIVVGDSFTIADIMMGLLIDHTYRGDLQGSLQSPLGTTVTLFSSDGGNGLDNYNVIFDEASTNLVNNAPHNTDDGLVAPPYENQVWSEGLFTDFYGEDAQGTWVIDLCDTFSGDSGNFQRANLYFTAAPAPTDADLSMAISASDTTPTEGTNVTLTYTISNSGPLATDGVTSQITLPSGLTYVGDNGGGSYNSGTGLWTIAGSIANGGSSSLQITAFVELVGTYTAIAEIQTATEPDTDSTPGNGNTGEDDYDTLTLIPVTPPVASLLCPGAASVVNWDTESWPTGSLSNAYTVDGETITMTITDPNNWLIADPINGGQTPLINTTLTGGYSPIQSNVFIVADPTTQANIVDITLALGTPAKGVSKLQLTLFDVDFGAAQFEDLITVTGTLNGTSVSTTLTPGPANSVSGNVATGTLASGLTSGNGNLTIEFSSAVDNVVISYGNGPGAPANPGVLGIGIHDIFFCPATAAVLGAQKSTAVYDPLSEGLYMVPGNDVIYTIDVTNTGDGPADSGSIELIDAMPPEIEFYNGDIDDGGPESNPVAFSETGTGLTFTYATDVAYSNAGVKPANFAACSYSPSAGYDPAITFICIKPQGAMAAGGPDPTFQVQFRARIK